MAFNMRYLGKASLRRATSDDKPEYDGEVIVAVIESSHIPGGRYDMLDDDDDFDFDFLNTWLDEHYTYVGSPDNHATDDRINYIRGRVYATTGEEQFGQRHEDVHEVGERLRTLLLADVLRRERDEARALEKARQVIDSRVGAPEMAPSARQRRPIPDDVKMFVWRRDEGRCISCNSNAELEFDHIIPVSMGGSNTARNLQLLCGSCNRAKGGNLV